MSTVFINRQSELSALDEINGRKGAQFVAVYGRRRIGKTSVLVQWLEMNKRTKQVYWVAHRSTSSRLLAKFSQALQPILGTADPDFSFSSWEAALNELGRLAAKEHLVIVMDELPYLLESAPNFASLLQAAWDHALQRSQLRLLVAGSHYHMMHDTFVSGRGPLFGRTTADMLIREVGPDAMAQFLPGYSAEQLVEVYSVVGGIPKYLDLWNDRRPVLRNVQDLILSPNTIFRNESIFLIQDEIADPRTYVAVLEAIGIGARRPVEIAKASGVNIAHIGKYLHTLETLRFTRRTVSLEAPNPSSARTTQHEIRDPYLRFHFTFVQPHLRLLEQERIGRVMERVRAGFDAYVGRTGYEELCRQYVADLADNGELPFEALEVGRIWDRNTEIDIAALDRSGRTVLLGECRWRRKKMTPADLEHLKARAGQLKKLKGFRFHYALFSRSGFTAALKNQAKQDGTMLFEGVPMKR